MEISCFSETSALTSKSTQAKTQDFYNMECHLFHNFIFLSSQHMYIFLAPMLKSKFALIKPYCSFSVWNLNGIILRLKLNRWLLCPHANVRQLNAIYKNMYKIYVLFFISLSLVAHVKIKLVLDTDTRWRWVVSIMLQCLYTVASSLYVSTG
jgi:hypothetical protein